MTEADDKSFLNRWSQRKLSGPESDREETAVAPEAPEPVDERSDAEILAELDLPEPESLNEGDDFSAFLKDAVPQRLRNRALRRLWLTNPVLANLDELVDYGEDFTDGAKVVENLQTAWKVGKGLLSDEPEPSDKIAEASEEEGIPTDGKDPEEADAADSEDAFAEADEQAELAAHQANIARDAPEPEIADPGPRRMRFRFDPA